MISLYRGLIQLASPILKLYFYGRCFYGKDRWEDVQNHFGKPSLSRPEGPLIWIHAVSIGESTSALTYIKHLKQRRKDLNILLTTTTVTSADIIRSKFKNLNGCFHQFSVADNPNWIKKFLDYWKPQKAIFLESEIWPNTINELYRRDIPTFLLNARLSPRSFKRWSCFKSDFSDILKKFTGILAQSDLDAERYSFFSKENVYKIDNLKYANELLPCNEELLSKLKNICYEKKVFVAASTHEGEEEEIIKAHSVLKKSFKLITIIIPRHLTRIANICALFDKYQISYELRSKINENSPTEVICVDTFGDVGACFRVADVTFVGGSLITVGGHNIYEPVALGKPVLHGPHMENALETRDLLHKNKLAFEVNSAKDIEKECRRFFSDKKLLNDIEKRSKYVTDNNSLKQIDEIINII